MAHFFSQISYSTSVSAGRWEDQLGSPVGLVVKLEPEYGQENTQITRLFGPLTI